jgi:isopenicillin N synthase-like dioxygenase
MTTSVPLVHLDRWLDGSDPAGVAAAVDAALRDVGFFMLAGHGVPRAVIDDTRRAYHDFFHLPAEQKATVRMPQLGEAGWAPMGMEANGYSFGHETPPDMKESYRIGAHALPGRVALRGDNAWPPEPIGFRSLVERYLAEVDRVHMELLRVCAAALGLADLGFFADRSRRNDNTLNVNWYPSVEVVGAPAPGQYRIGPHTDFGTLTVLHREPGSADLQVQLPGGDWVDAPVFDDAFTVNCGDILALWSGRRWRSAIHRVLPPTDDARELLSVVYFCDPDPDTIVRPLDGSDEPVRAADYLRTKIEAITMPAID